MRIVPLLGLLLLAPGCVLHTRGPLPRPAPHRHPRPAPAPRPPPPPSRPSVMGYDEAVSRGHDFCRSRGYDCRLKEAHTAEGGDKWKVKFTAYAPGARGHLHLVYNAYSRALLKVDEKVKDRGHGKGKGRGRGHGKHDRDWDDDWDD